MVRRLSITDDKAFHPFSEPAKFILGSWGCWRLSVLDQGRVHSGQVGSPSLGHTIPHLHLGTVWNHQ